MEHLASPNLTYAATIALVVLAGGLVFARLRQPPLVAYILAGVILGPLTGWIEGGEALETMAEFGVLMLLFFIGIKLDLSFFRRVWRIAVVTTVLEIAGALLIALLVGRWLGWHWQLAVFFGFALALSSTAAASQMLPQLTDLPARVGQMTLAILVAQDLAVAPMIQIISTLSALESGGGAFVLALGRLALAMALLAVLVWWLSRTNPELRLRRFFGALRKNEQLAPVAGIFFCFGAAVVAGWVGFSAAYGAFLAGMVAGNSAGRSLILRQMEPLQVILVIMFFFSIGILLDPTFLYENLPAVLFSLAFVMIIKTVIHTLVLIRLGETPSESFAVSVMLSNIGEFSFVIAAVGLSVGLVAEEHHAIVLAVSVLSLAVTPVYVFLARRSHAHFLAPIHIGRRARLEAEAARAEPKLRATDGDDTPSEPPRNP